MILMKKLLAWINRLFRQPISIFKKIKEFIIGAAGERQSWAEHDERRDAEITARRLDAEIEDARIASETEAKS